jgi:hypothetical protein
MPALVLLIWLDGTGELLKLAVLSRVEEREPVGDVAAVPDQ